MNINPQYIFCVTIRMGQVDSKNTLDAADLKVGTCFKSALSGGDGPYNYCEKLVKKTKMKANKWGYTYRLSTKIPQRKGNQVFTTTASSNYRYKKCKCPTRRKTKI